MSLNKSQIFVLLVVLALGACKKEEIKIERNTPSTPKPALLREGGGDDDDEPIVQGLVLDGSSNPQNGEFVELFKEGELFPIQDTSTDSDGVFAFQAPVGNYFIKVSPQVGNPVLTDIFTLASDMSITITLE